MSVASSQPRSVHPILRSALRLPPNGAPWSAADWDALPSSADGIVILRDDADALLAALGETATAPFDAELLAREPFELLNYLSRHARLLAEPQASLRRVLAGVVRRHRPKRARLALELGCSVGADLRMLRRNARAVLGVDTYIPLLRVAQRQLAGLPIDYPVRHEGRRFSWADPPLTLPKAPPDIALVCADALAPDYIAPEAADIALAANLIDNVPDPLRLLSALDAVLRPGGLLVLATPLHWQEHITPPESQLGGSPAPPFVGRPSEEALQAILRGEHAELPLRYRALETREARWTIREHDRCRSIYRVHVLAAQKLESRPSSTADGDSEPKS